MIAGPVERLSRFVSVDQARSGSRETRTVVLIHGWCCTSRVWERCRPEIDEVYDVATVSIAYESLPEIVARSATPRALSQAVAEIVDRTLGDRLIIVGHSLGGRIAYAVASILGSRVERIVAVNAIRGVRRPSGLGRLSEAALLAGLSFSFPRARRALVQTMFGTETLDDTRRLVAQMIEAVPRHAAALTLAHSVRDPMGDLLTGPRTRVTALNSRDFGVIGSQAASLEDKVAFRKLPINGHFPMLEKPRLFASSLIDELERKGAENGRFG